MSSMNISKPYDVTNRFRQDRDFYGACHYMEEYIKKNGDKNDTLSQLYQLRVEYDMSVSWWREGKQQPESDDMLDNYFMPQLYIVWDNYMMLDQMTSSNNYLIGLRNKVRGSGKDWTWQEVKKTLENFSANITVAALQEDMERGQEKTNTIRDEQYRYRCQLFHYTLTSLMLAKTDKEKLLDILLTPTIDRIDQLLIVAALTLNGCIIADPVKAELMMDVYKLSGNTMVSQYALVGIVMMYKPLVSFANVDSQLHQLIDTDTRVCEDISQLLMQISYCRSAEKDSKEFTDKVMPQMMATSDIEYRDGKIQMKEEDPMDDILGRGGEQERRMEELEKTMNSLISKRSQGVDFFFEGFKRMKNYPVFNDITNWLMPFYMEHPMIRTQMEKLKKVGTLASTMLNSPVCDNDKYSFVYAFANIAGSLPEELLDNLKINNMTNDDMDMMSKWNNDGRVVRRSYVQSLYRFYRLFAYRESFGDPFDSNADFMTALANTRFVEYIPDLLRFYLRRDDMPHANKLVDIYNESHGEMTFDIAYLKAIINMKTSDDVSMVANCFERCIAMAPENILARKTYARYLFSEKRYIEAAEQYDRLMAEQQDEKKWMLYYSICRVNICMADKALPILFRLDYEYPNDPTVILALSKALLYEGRAEEAEKKLLTAYDETDVQMVLTMGLVLWAQGKRLEAAETFSRAGADIGKLLKDELNGYIMKKMSLSNLEVMIMMNEIRKRQQR